MNIETKWLEDFLSLADTQSFSRSASERHVTQPAFSRRIRALEDMLGCELVDRRQQPVQLTPAGKLFRVTARNLMTQLKDSISHIHSLNQRQDAVIDFALSHSLSLSFFPRFIVQLQKELPPFSSRQLVANVDDSTQALKNGVCDFLLAFHDSSLAGHRFEQVLLRRDRLIPVCRPDARGKPRFDLDARSVSPLPYLAYPEDIYLGRMVSRHMARRDTQGRLQRCFESPMADSLKLMAIQGSGIAWVPSFVIEDELDQGLLLRCGDSEWEIPLSISLYRCREALSPEAELLWQRLSERYGDENPGVDGVS